MMVVTGRSLTALERAYVHRRWGTQPYYLPAKDRPSDTELLAWAATLSDAELLGIRNIGATSVAWIRAQVPRPGQFDYLGHDGCNGHVLAWHEGFEEGLQVGRAVGAAAVVGPAFTQGLLYTGAVNGSASRNARDTLPPRVTRDRAVTNDPGLQRS